MSSGRLRIAVLYGGRSGEHEVSLQSAASVIRHLDPERFEVVPIGIDRRGRWHLGEPAALPADAVALPVHDDAPGVLLPPFAEGTSSALIPVADGPPQPIDVVFPVMHGPLCEDGSIQGLCELADVPYVGSGVLASAVGMDKDVAKRLASAAGIPVVPYLAVRAAHWEAELARDGGADLTARAVGTLGCPLFVKPANMGSSVGVHKVREPGEFLDALADAFRFDTKVLVEKGLDAREIELAVLQNPAATGDAMVSVPGEIVPAHDFYSYEAKYLDENGAALLIPASLDPAQGERARAIAREAFAALECEGMARVDLFLERGSGEWYFNEINTIPGFTTISMYPKLWEASGLSYRDLLSHLIDLALDRHRRRGGLARQRTARG